MEVSYEGGQGPEGAVAPCKEWNVAGVINILFVCAVCYVVIRGGLLYQKDRNHPKIPGARRMNSALKIHKY